MIAADTPTGIKRIADVLEEAQSKAVQALEKDPERALQIVTVKNKSMIGLDYEFELWVGGELKRLFGPANIRIRGEEFQGAGSDQQLLVILDAIDGTDLVIRNFGNWCSAVAFVRPKQPQIVSAFVAKWQQGVYYATRDEDGAWFRPFKQKAARRVSLIESAATDLANASICFYGQKVSRLKDLASRSQFLQSLEALGGDTRIYNLAGNPMMMSMLEGHKRVDAVFDLCGQKAHDFVPGAFIATKAGAILTDLEGKAMNLHALAVDGRSYKYVLAATRTLSSAMIGALRKVENSDRDGADSRGDGDFKPPNPLVEPSLQQVRIAGEP